MPERYVPKKLPEAYEVDLAIAIVTSEDLSGMQIKDIHRRFLTCLNEIRADQEFLRKRGTVI